jgi:F0F1-type ATP synthase delta subunit
MKIKPKIYAEALAQIMAERKSAQEKEKIVEKFLKLLEKNGDMGKAKEILAFAENLFIKKTGRRKVVIETARKADKKALLKEIEMAGDIVQEKINPELIAGIKIIINDQQLDLSLQKKLQTIFK